MFKCRRWRSLKGQDCNIDKNNVQVNDSLTRDDGRLSKTGHIMDNDS
jgi:hypothetical protein